MNNTPKSEANNDSNNFIQKYWIIITIVFFFSSFINPAISMLIMGLLIIYVSVSTLLLLKRIHDNGLKVFGKILSYQRGRKGYKTPIIEFTPVGGESITAEPCIYASTDLSKVRSYQSKIDTEIIVLYDPEDPKKFVIANERQFNYIVIFILIIGGLFFIVLSFANFLGYFKWA